MLGRVVEVVSGKALDAFFKARIYDPLGMTDTGFFVPEAKQERFVAYYRGADVLDPMKPGLFRIDDLPYPQAYRRPFPRLSGGGGLVTTMPDMLALVRALLPGPDTLLKPETIRQMMTNQLPGGQTIRFATLGPDPRQGLWPGRRRDLRADAVRSAKFNRRISMGRRRRHALVDLSGGQYGRRADGAARDGFLESVLLRIQASRL